MKRRGFLAAAAAVPAAALFPFAKPATSPFLAFDSRAFALAMDPLSIPRMDILYGYGALMPGLACRVENYPEPEPGGFMRYVAASAEAEGRS